MSNKIISAIIIVIIIGGGSFFLFKNKTTAPVNINTEGDSAAGTVPTGTTGDWTDTPEIEAPKSLGAPIETQTQTQSTTGKVKEFTVSASNFSFTPAGIAVNKGDTVKITLKNVTGFHDLRIDEFNVSTQILEVGKSETITFAADKSGTFQYYCSVGNHRAMGMVGSLSIK